MELDASMLNTQHYRVRIKGKVEQSREGVAPSPTPWCSSYRKGSLRVTLDYGQLTTHFIEWTHFMEWWESQTVRERERSITTHFTLCWWNSFLFCDSLPTESAYWFLFYLSLNESKKNLIYNHFLQVIKSEGVFFWGGSCFFFFRFPLFSFSDELPSIMTVNLCPVIGFVFIYLLPRIPKSNSILLNWKNNSDTETSLCHFKETHSLVGHINHP